MSLPNPPGILIALFVLYLLYRLFPRTIRCLFISLGVSFYRSSPADYRKMIEFCTTPHGDWEFDETCQGNVSLLVMEVVVYTIAIICAFTEVEGIISRRRFKEGKVA
jgi:hypothetical protein